MTLSLPRYETDQLISLVGSKRPIIDQLRLILSSLVNTRGSTLFIDPFCGSGSVSRLARSLGMDVRSCDLEPFSYIINHVYLTMHNDDLIPLFGEFGGLDAYLSMLHLEGLYAAQEGVKPRKPFLSAYYAPQSDEQYDGERERLFFTAANARYLDTVRDEIESSWVEGRISAREKAVVLASILYEASRRANTSGTFTSYHKQFHSGKRAIRSRIVQPCTLLAPTLVDTAVPSGEMHLAEASEFVKQYRADICFLDPPATVHQYGSAYHLLNSITIWDKKAPSAERDAQGRLLQRGGIREDWKQTHSPFCSLKHADRAFVHLFGNIDARHIVLTYPTNALVSADRLYELLSAHHAPVTVIPLQKRNQGGRQSAGGKSTIEQVFITGKVASFYLPVGSGLSLLPLVKRLDTLMSVVFRKSIELAPFSFIGGLMLDGLPPIETLSSMSISTLDQQITYLERQACTTDEEAVTVLLLACANSHALLDGLGRARLEKRLFSLLRTMIASMDKDESTQFYQRLDELLDHFSSSDATTKTLRQRLSSLFNLAYDTKKGGVDGKF